MPKKIARIMVSILTYVYVLTIVPLAVSGFFGIHCFAVISASMSPEIPTASLVLSKETDFDKLEVNDVITYLISEDQTVTRRIISIDKEKQKITTKGDANDQADSKPVSYENVVGKVIFHAPYIGHLFAITNKKGIVIFIAGMGIMLFALNFLLEDDKKASRIREKGKACGKQTVLT